MRALAQQQANRRMHALRGVVRSRQIEPRWFAEIRQNELRQSAGHWRGREIGSSLFLPLFNWYLGPSGNR